MPVNAMTKSTVAAGDEQSDWRSVVRQPQFQQS
jgi:hypothetical protein